MALRFPTPCHTATTAAFLRCGVWSVQTEGRFGIIFTLVLIAAPGRIAMPTIPDSRPN
jgi:hypothetical protein